MMNKILILTILIIVLSIKNVSCAMSQYKWMYFKPYGSTVNLEPLFNNSECTVQSQCYWLLPDKHTRLNYPITESTASKYSISLNGTLTIINIQSDDNGIYHFFQMNNSNWIVSKALLNMHGPPFDSIWAEYWPNVVGGLVAMAVILIIFSLIFLADKYRYRSTSPLTTRRLSKRSGTIEPDSESIVVERRNPVFINDDNLTITSQRRTNSRRSSSNSNGTELRVERL